MSKLAQMLAEVLDTKVSRTLAEEEAKKIAQEYFRQVATPLEEINRQKLQAAEDNRFVMCR